MRSNRIARPLFLLASLGVAFLTFTVMPGSTRNACAADSHNVPNSTDQSIDEHGQCQIVTNNTGNTIFVPTKTLAEWQSFITNGPAGATRASCVPPCGHEVSNVIDMATNGTFVYTISNSDVSIYEYSPTTKTYTLKNNKPLVAGMKKIAAYGDKIYVAATNLVAAYTVLPDGTLTTAGNAAITGQGQAIWTNGNVVAVASVNAGTAYIRTFDHSGVTFTGRGSFSVASTGNFNGMWSDMAPGATAGKIFTSEWGGSGVRGFNAAGNGTITAAGNYGSCGGTGDITGVGSNIFAACNSIGLLALTHSGSTFTLASTYNVGTVWDVGTTGSNIYIAGDAEGPSLSRLTYNGVNTFTLQDRKKVGDVALITDGAYSNTFAYMNDEQKIISFEDASCAAAPPGFGGWFVLSSDARNGNFGGISGATATCINDLTVNDWQGKGTVTLGYHNVKPFLCTSASCNNLEPDSSYAYATSGNPSAGGARFVTGFDGSGPNDSKSWEDADAFNTAASIYTGRSQGTSTSWPAAPGSGAGNYCNGWTTTAGGNNSAYGVSNRTDHGRWIGSTPLGCSLTNRYICIVDANAQPSNYACNAVAVGSIHACAIGDDRRAYCWGANADGQLGDDSTTLRSTPVRARDGAGPGLYRYITAGQYHTCGLAIDDKAYCWGSNYKSAVAQGMLGTGNSTNSQVPVSVVAGESPGKFKEISAGQYHTCGLAIDDKIYCWGTNNFGQLGDGTTTFKLSPVAVINGAGPGTYKKLSVKGNNVCAIGTDDKGYCWGYGASHQIGDGVNTNRNSPALVSNGTSPGTFKEITTGTGHSCAIGTDDKAYCWGVNTNRQIGDNTNTTRTTPVLVSNGENTAGTYKKIYAGNGTTHAIGTDDKAYGWGQNTTGQTGDGTTTTPRGTPRMVVNGASPGTFTSISGTEFAGTSACAVATNGKVYCWGVNTSSQLGDGTTTQRTSPVAVSNGQSTGNFYQCPSQSESEPEPEPIDPTERIVFVSSAQYNGNLGGADGAHAKCQAHADTANLPGVFKAWIGTDTYSPSTAFEKSAVPYMLPNGTKVADNWADLTDGTLDSSINVTEAGTTIPNGNAWTDLTTAGVKDFGGCTNWTSTSGNGDHGDITAVNQNWTDQTNSSCSNTRRLYCFQQVKGFYVLSDNTSNANFGGIPHANMACLSQLKSTNWKGKSEAVLNSTTVKASLCIDNQVDPTMCNDLQADKTYAFATMGSPTTGGATMTTNSSGNAPNDSANWSGANYFGTNATYWSNRTTGGSATQITTGGGGILSCVDWTSSAMAQFGGTAVTNNTNANRWTGSTQSCNSSQRYVCTVHPYTGSGHSSCTKAGGYNIGGYCWFAGKVNESCATACSRVGGTYNAATQTYAGSSGTNANCDAVLDALSIGGSSLVTQSTAMGCGRNTTTGARNRGTQPTTDTASGAAYARACACTMPGTSSGETQHNTCGSWTPDDCRSTEIDSTTGVNAAQCLTFCQNTPGATCCRREGTNCWAHAGGISGDSNEPSEYAAACTPGAPAPSCASVGGEEVNSGCWFHGAMGASCTATCSGLGAGWVYDDMTRTYAGSDGTNVGCQNVMNAVGAGGGGAPGGQSNSYGCHTVTANRYRGNVTTDASSASAAVSRMCACKYQ